MQSGFKSKLPASPNSLLRYQGVAVSNEQFEPALIDGPAFGKLALAQFSDRSSEGSQQPWSSPSRMRLSPARRLQFLKATEILFSDELGKVRPTPVILEELFALIDHRHSHNLFTIWASNRLPTHAFSEWNEEYAAPIAGRIVEISDIFAA